MHHPEHWIEIVEVEALALARRVGDARAAFTRGDPETLGALHDTEHHHEALGDPVALGDVRGALLFPGPIGTKVFVGPPGLFGHLLGRLANFSG